MSTKHATSHLYTRGGTRPEGRVRSGKDTWGGRIQAKLGSRCWKGRRRTVCESPSGSAITNGYSPASPPLTWREGVSLTQESTGAGQVPDSFIRERDIVPFKQRRLWGLLSTVFALLFSFCLGSDLAVYIRNSDVLQFRESYPELEHTDLHHSFLHSLSDTPMLLST